MSDYLARIFTEDLRSRFAALCAESPEIRVLGYMFGVPQASLWVHSIGVCRDPELASRVPELPTAEMRGSVADSTPQVFLWTGVQDADFIAGLFARFRRGIEDRTPVILDFGSGCGRISRFFDGARMPWIAHACDPDEGHVAWCRSNLRTVRTIRSPRMPPLPYGESTFDLVHAVGVFTQLGESSALSWLRELERILRPGGVLVVTVHGEAALATIAASSQHRSIFRLTADECTDLELRLPSAGYLFSQHDEEGLRFARAQGEYGVSFVHGNHVRSKWASPALELLEHLPAGMRGFDDVLVFRRR